MTFLNPNYFFYKRNTFLRTIISDRYFKGSSFEPLRHPLVDISRRYTYSIPLVCDTEWRSGADIRQRDVGFWLQREASGTGGCFRCWNFSPRPPCPCAGLEEPGLVSRPWRKVDSSQPDIEAPLVWWVSERLFGPTVVYVRFKLIGDLMACMSNACRLRVMIEVHCGYLHSGINIRVAFQVII